MTKEEYRRTYPGALLVSEEYSSVRTAIVKRQWEDPEFKEAVRQGALDLAETRRKITASGGIWLTPEGLEKKRECGRKLIERNERDPHFISRRSTSKSCSEVTRLDRVKLMTQLNERQWKDPDFVSRAQKRSSLTMTSINERNWKDPSYREMVKSRSSLTLTRVLKKLWLDSSYRDKMSIHNSKILASQGRGVSSGPHKIVSEYLTSIGVSHENEVFVDGVRVDIYLPTRDLVIEVNGEYFHGDPSRESLQDMTDLQRAGYYRDQKRERLFGKRVLFLWEYRDIYTDQYQGLINSFIRDRGGDVL
jgi:hypothetical protein